MALVLGKDTILYVRQSGIFLPIACSRNCVFVTNTETAGKSTIGSGLFREYKPIVNSGTLSADGVVSFDNNISVMGIRYYQLNFVELEFQFRVVEESGEGALYSGTLIITSVTETGNYNDIATYSIQAVVTGEITITSTVGNPGIIYFNTQDNFDDPTDFTQFITANPDLDIIINYQHPESALYYWMAHSISALQKTNWDDENDTGNNGTIGGSTDLFQVRIISINGFDFICYMTAYATFFNGYDPIVKFFRIPTGCLPPTDFKITDIQNSDADTGRILQLTTFSNYITYQIFGVFVGGGIFNFSIYGTLVSFTTVAGMSVEDAVNGIIAAINNASIVALDPPPSVVSAFAIDAVNGRFAIMSGTPPNSTASYLSPFVADITFDWIEPDPAGVTYTIRIINEYLSTTDYNVGGAPTRVVQVRRGFTYRFAIRTDCDNGSSDWSDEIVQSIP